MSGHYLTAIPWNIKCIKVAGVNSGTLGQGIPNIKVLTIELFYFGGKKKTLDNSDLTDVLFKNTFSLESQRAAAGPLRGLLPE